MPTRDPRVDAYIAKAPAFAQPILVHVRTIVHEVCPLVDETMKWSSPHFDYKGMMCAMVAFKAHCGVGFWKASLIEGLRDAKADGDTAAGHLGQLRSVDDLPSDGMLRGYIESAMRLNDEGTAAPKPAKAPRPELPVPPELAAALASNRTALDRFEAFPPSHRREYIEWITEAKRDETRTKRIVQTIEWVAEGKSRNWKYVLVLMLAVALAAPGTAHAQEPAAWGTPLNFATFSIAAIDPRTGESGVAVTTRVPCVGNGVPWVRAGVGAVATQANTRTEYGTELLDLLATGLTPDAALARALEADTGRAGRQIGVVSVRGGAANYTGTGTTQWAGGRSSRTYTTQGNLLVSRATIDAVAENFEASEGSPRHLADRLIDAIAAGNAMGGDARKGRAQSAAVVIADPRPGRSRRADRITAFINVCENPEPVKELRRIYNAISQTLGYRDLMQMSGNDVWQLKVILHALGFYRSSVSGKLERDSLANEYVGEIVTAVDQFRTSEHLATASLGSPSGLVDPETVARLWAALERAGKARAVREELLDGVAVRR